MPLANGQLGGADCVPGNVHLLPPADFYGGYIDGLFQSFPEIRAAFPSVPCVCYTVLGHAIAPFAGTPKLILDVETGNPVQPSEVPAWFRQELALGWPLDKLAVYGSASIWGAIDGACANAGISLTHANRNVAIYDGIADVTHVVLNGFVFPADHFGAKQYSDKGGPADSAGNHAYDLQASRTDWLSGVVPPIPPLPPGVDPMSVAIAVKGDGNLVALAQAEAKPGEVGEVYQLYTTQGGPDASGGPVWHGKKGVTAHFWQSIGIPGA